MKFARAFVVGGMVALMAVACSDAAIIPRASGTTNGSGGTTASSSSSSTTSSSSASSSGVPDAGPEASACPTPSRPWEVPAGWVPWTDWSCKCPLWIPAETPGPPVAWEPCAVLSPPGTDCKQMVIDWPYIGDPMGLALFEPGTDGKGELVFTRAAHYWMDQVIARADGPVLFTARQTQEKGCAMFIADFNEGLASIDATGNGSAPDSQSQGVILASVTDAMPVLAPPQTNNGELWEVYVGKQHAVKFIGPSRVAQLYSADFSVETQLWPPPGGDPDNLPYEVGTRIVGSDVLFQVGDLSATGIMAYDPVLGVHPLIRYYGDTAQAAFNGGTDGQDLVWTHGADRTPIPANYVYPTRSVMTAKYTTDPKLLVPRRLRSEPSNDLGLDPYAVGCGYAGHRASGQDLFLVRLSDGVSWILPHVGTIWGWGRVIGFTCTEVFVQTVTPILNVARIRLDSLGPGTPPD